MRPLKLKNETSAVISQIAFSDQPASASFLVSSVSMNAGFSVNFTA